MSTRELTPLQQGMLTGAAVPMIAVGGFGAWGTYTNVIAEFGRAATAMGVVAAGEGLTLVLALTMLALTLLGQATPRPVHVGLWLAPAAASGVGISIADSLTEAVVYGATPLAMSGAAEGLGLIARRIVIYTTGVDAEAEQRTARLAQQLAFEQAVAERHPDESRRASATSRSWKLVSRIGRDDSKLAAGLVEDQRKRLRQGADTALAGMLTARPPTDTGPAPQDLAKEVLSRKLAAMGTEDAVHLVRDAHPDAPPAELAAILTNYGVHVTPVQVALILGQWPEQYEVHRPDTPHATSLDPVTVEGAVVEAASVLGPDAKAREIAERILRERRLVVTEQYVRTALSRAAKRQDGDEGIGQGGGGYA